MAARLREIAANPDPRNPYHSSARLQALRGAQPSSDPLRRLAARGGVAQELLHLGRFEESLTEFETLVREIDASGTSPDEFVLAIRESMAIARLKRWERDNCVARPDSRLCLFPIEGVDGRSADAGVRTALAIYESLLQTEPENLTNRWLLNLGNMMLGAYPDGVPSRWLIPPEAWRSEHDIGRYPEIANDLGLDVYARAGGSIIDDFDGDGDLDVVASSWDLRDQLRFFVNDSDGAFSDRTTEAGLNGIVGGLNLIQADYDNDGALDILVLRGAWQPIGEPNSLLRNHGDGTFQDVTLQAGLTGEHSTQTGAWGDYDGDGWLDLYIGHESTEGRRNPNQLFHNNGDGTFTDVAAEAGVAIVGFAKGVVWGDVDNDGRLDLYISRLHQPNLLFRNEGPDATGRWRFSDVTARAGVGEPTVSFPTWFWDYDNDGWLDIFVSGYRAVPGDIAAEYLGTAHDAELPRLYRNDRDGGFSDVTAAVRLDRINYAMGANFGDLDNDGYLDFYAGTGDPDLRLMIPNRMFRNAGGRVFQDVTTSGGFGHLGKGHGVSFGDLDNDGDQDIYATIGGMLEGDFARNVTFENPGHGAHWITLRLQGVRSNRSAIGARIKVALDTPRGPRQVHATVSSGGSFGANSLQQEIGLGDATAIRSVVIIWPGSAAADTLTGLAMDRIYHVREGEPAAAPVAATSFRLAPSRAAPTSSP